MKNKLNVILSAALFLLTTTVTATPIESINFKNNNEGIADSFWFESAGVSLTVTAWTTSVNDQQTALEPWQLLSGEQGVYKGNTGLGVVSSDNDGVDLDGGSSGDFASDADEGLLFVFSEQVNLLAFIAGELSSNDDLNFSVVSVLTPDTLETNNLFNDRNNGQAKFELSSDAFGYAFMLWVDGNDDDVRIESIEFSRVPEPETISIFLIGLIALVLANRAKKKP